MARAKLLLGLMALCFLVSACEKAKMRTVAPQDPNASASADPGLPPPSSPDPQDDYQAEPLPEQEPVVSHTPPPPAPSPVSRLDDGDDYEDIEIERRTDGPLHRPQPRRRPVPRRNSPCCEEKVVVIEEDCPPEQREVIVRERPRPRPLPRRPAPVPVRDELVLETREVELNATSDLHCRWEPTGKPLTYLRFSPVKRIAWVKHGWPQKWAQYTNVRLVSGLPPYGIDGVTLVTSQGEAIASLKASNNAKIVYEQDTTYPYEATFGIVPGGPKSRVRGVCWSKDEPAKTEYR